MEKKRNKQKVKALLLAIMPIIFMFGFELLMLTIYSIIVAGEVQSDQMGDLMGLAGLVLATVMTCIIVRKFRKVSLRRRLTIAQFRPMLIISTFLLVFCGGEILAEIIGRIAGLISSSVPDTNPEIGIVTTIGVVLVSPICEEILFRFAMVEFTQGLFSVYSICIGNGLIFALMHGYGVQGLLTTMLFGMILVFVYCRTGNLLCPIAVHIINNLICSFPIHSLCIGGNPIYYIKNGYTLSSLPWLLINGIGLLGGIILFERSLKNR